MMPTPSGLRRFVAVLLSAVIALGMATVWSSGASAAGHFGSAERESVATGVMGSQAFGGGSSVPELSPDGRFVAFSSDATDLVSDDTNRVTDVFVRDRQSATTQRVSVDSSGQRRTWAIWSDRPPINLCRWPIRCLRELLVARDSSC